MSHKPDMPPKIDRIVPQKRHRILCLQTSSVFESYGGIEYYLDDLLTLAVEAYGPDAVHTVIPLRRPDTMPKSSHYSASFVRYSQNKWLSKIENRFSLKFFREAERLARQGKPTLILNAHVSLGPLAYTLGLIHRIPVITIAYGYEVWANLFPQDEFCLKHSAGILSISEWTKKILTDRGYASEKIQIFHPGLPRGYEKNPPPVKMKPYGNDFKLITVSRLDAKEQYKGHDHVIEALQRVRQTEPDLKLTYLIYGDGSDRARLEKMVADKQLSKIVEFKGAVKDRSQFENAYKEADVFIMPSRFGKWENRWRGEGFGIVYLEAAAFGLPSIAYNCGGVTDIIQHGSDGLLAEPDNIAELARFIVKLAKEPEYTFRMGQRAYQRTMDRFTRGPLRRELVSALDHW